MTIFIVSILALLQVALARRGLSVLDKDALMQRDLSNWNLVVSRARAEEVSIAGFFHVPEGSDGEVVSELLRFADGQRGVYGRFGMSWGSGSWSSVLSASESLQVTVAHNDRNAFRDVQNTLSGNTLKHGKKVHVTKSPSSSAGGISAINAVHEYCSNKRKSDKKAMVYFFHALGGSRPPDSDPGASWRELLSTFTLQFPSVCATAVLDGYATCGAEYQDAHYSGNFWWADCDHVSSLTPLAASFDTSPMGQFIFNVSSSGSERDQFGQVCGYAPVVCRVDHFKQACPRPRYAGRLQALLTKSPLPESATGVAAPLAFVQQHCRRLARGGPYASQAGFNAGIDLPPVPLPLPPTTPVLVSDEFIARDSIASAQMRLMQKDVDLFATARAQVREKGYALRGYYHVSRWKPFWREVLEEQLRILDGQRQFGDRAALAKAGQAVPWSSKTFSSLLQASEQLYLNVAGSSDADQEAVSTVVRELHLQHASKVYVGFNKTVGRTDFSGASPSRKQSLLANTQLSEGEYSTVTLMQDYCRAKVQAGEKAVVYYFHSKGGCCSRKQAAFNPVASWREAMNTFNLEYPSICLRAMLEGYPTCGFEYQDAHYSGNYWWANCNHVAALPTVWTRFDAWVVEFFALNVSAHHLSREHFGEACAYNTHKCVGVDHYHQECDASTYTARLSDLVANYALPLTATQTDAARKGAAVRDACASMSAAGKYADQVWYKERNDLFPLSVASKAALEIAPPVAEPAPSDVDVAGTIKEKRELLLKEWELWRKALSESRTKGFLLTGFYHVTAQEEHWREVLEEQLLILDGKRQLGNKKAPFSSGKYMPWSPREWPSLLKASSDLHLNVAGNSADDLKLVEQVVLNLKLRNAHKISFSHNYTIGRTEFRNSNQKKKAELLADSQLSEGEVSTVMRLHQYCRNTVQAGEKAVVYYFHSKGGCCSRKQAAFNPVASWREAMNTFNLEYPSICLRAMLEGYPTCGFEYQDAHYRLPSIEDRFDFSQAGSFVFNVDKSSSRRQQFGSRCALSTYNCKVDHFQTECGFEEYRQTLASLVSTVALPVPATGPSTVAERSKECFPLQTSSSTSTSTSSSRLTTTSAAVNSVHDSAHKLMSVDSPADFPSLNLQDEQMYVMSKEKDVFQQALQQASERGVTLTGFYHVSRWMPNWKEVLVEQLKIIDGDRQFGNRSEAALAGVDLPWSTRQWPSLLSASTNVFLNVAGPTNEDRAAVSAVVNSLKLAGRDKIVIGFNKTLSRGTFLSANPTKRQAYSNTVGVSEGEVSTILALHRHCKAKVQAGEKAVVYYFHSKGGCCSRKQAAFNPVASWREAMNTFNLEYPSICLRAMLKGYKACGFSQLFTPVPHYSGNFWWADCDHVSSLPTLPLFDSYAAEFFLFNTHDDLSVRAQFAAQCSVSSHRCPGVDHYQQECPPESYQTRLRSLVLADDWLVGEGVASELCASSRQGPYPSIAWQYDWALK